jgi:hypothetical protein
MKVVTCVAFFCLYFREKQAFLQVGKAFWHILSYRGCKQVPFLEKHDYINIGWTASGN